MNLGDPTQWGVAGAVGLGVAAALHPCPFSAALGALLIAGTPSPRTADWPEAGRRSGWRVAAMVLGLMAATAIVAAATTRGLLHVRYIAIVLPDVLHPLLAPLFIVAGVLQARVFATGRAVHGETRMVPWRLPACRLSGCFGLGLMLALSFCPASAGLFFGVLIPLAVASGQPLRYGGAYAFGHGLPLVVAALAVAAGLRLERVRRFTDRIAAASGWFLIGLGAWLTWRLI